ncbi:TetR/AcrR family transcriptional regulator [Desulfonauticus submarinus]
MRLKGSQRREKILKAAKKLFAQKGFKGTTTKMLAQEAGISESSLYKYFSSKEEIYLNLLEQKIKDIGFYFPIKSKNSLKDTLKSIVVQFLKRNTKDPSFVKIFLYASLEEHEISKNILSKLRNIFFSRLESLFQIWIQEKKIKKMDKHLLSKFFFGLLYYSLLLKTIFPDDEFNDYTIEEIANNLTEIFLEGVLYEQK